MAKQAKTFLSEPATTETRWPFGKRNYIMLAVALAVIIIGYIALGMGSITLAPLLLVVGYCVLIPVALIIKDPSRTRAAGSDDTPPAP